MSFTFEPSLQGYVGPHTPDSVTTPACVDWTNGVVYLAGPAPDGEYLCAQSLSLGTELAYVLQSSFTDTPAPDFEGQFCVGVDRKLYFGYGTFGGDGGIVAVDGVALTQTSFTTPAAAIDLGGGCVFSSVTAAGTGQFTIGCGEGSEPLFQNDGVFEPVTFTGFTFEWPEPTGGNSTGFSCGGLPGSGLGYVAIAPGGVPGADNATWLYKVSCGSTSTQTLLKKYAPTDFLSEWTTVGINGLCIDQTDGNIILSVAGTGGSTAVLGVIAKASRANGALLWVSPCPKDPPGGDIMQFSQITVGRFGYYTQAPNQVTFIDTTNGTSQTFTGNLDGIATFGRQCFNDTLNAIFLDLDFSHSSDSPTLLNSTPDSFNGYGLLYLGAETEPAPSGMVYTRTWGRFDL